MKGTVRSPARLRTPLLVAALALLLESAAGRGGGAGARVRLGPLVSVSGLSPFLNCTQDNVPRQPGTVYLNSSVEPSLAINPRDPRNIAAAWQQDRWSRGLRMPEPPARAGLIRPSG